MFSILQSVMPCPLQLLLELKLDQSNGFNMFWSQKSLGGLENLINHLNLNAHFLRLSLVCCELLVFLKTIAKNLNENLSSLR